VAGEHHDGQAACGQGARVMNIQRHHIILSAVAIVVAVALMLNYYLW
jgi:hypothetical protein